MRPKDKIEKQIENLSLKASAQLNAKVHHDIDAVATDTKVNTRRKYAAIAAGLIVAVGLFTVTMQKNLQQPGDVLTAELVERKISDSASAVRLLATASLLREYDEAKDTLNKLYKHIIATYPDTAAAMEATTPATARKTIARLIAATGVVRKVRIHVTVRRTVVSHVALFPVMISRVAYSTQRFGHGAVRGSESVDVVPGVGTGHMKKSSLPMAT